MQCAWSGLQGPGSQELAVSHPVFIIFPALGPGGHGEDPTQGQAQDKSRTGNPRGYMMILAAAGHRASGPKLSSRGGGGSLEAKPLCLVNLKINR